MNGRVYDASIARFISADPFIQSPDYLQSYNRYSYVLNNPLGYVDPSGYFSLSQELRNARDNIENVVENVGGMVINAVESVGNVVVNVVEEVGDFAEDNAELIGRFCAVYLDSIGCGGYCSATFLPIQLIGTEGIFRIYLLPH